MPLLAIAFIAGSVALLVITAWAMGLADRHLPRWAIGPAFIAGALVVVLSGWLLLYGLGTL